MGKEIERKFLLANDSWRTCVQSSTFVRQGYLCSAKERTVRVRIADGKAYLTVKGPNRGLERAEFEYEIPEEDAMAILDSLAERPLIEKIRHIVFYAGMTWEIDEFAGENKGLVMAEVELEAVDQSLIIPDWVGKDVSSDPRYYNSYLVKNPYGLWQNK